MRAGTNPQVPNSGGRGGSDANEDGDDDGLINSVEQRLRARSAVPGHRRQRVRDGDEDNDHDGFSNLYEVNAATTPPTPQAIRPS